MRIKVEIDELVLHGFDGANGAQVGKFLEAELATLLASGNLHSGSFQDNRALKTVEGGPIDIQRGSGTSKSLGTEIARAVYGGLGKVK